jgi:hypothetical protein
MKNLLKSLVIAAAPLLLREILRRMGERQGRRPRRRTPLLGRSR